MPSAREGARVAVSPQEVVGSLLQMSVADIVQMLELGRKSARVDVHALEAHKGTLHVHDGQLVAAASDELEGEGAVLALLRCKEGTFRIFYERRPCTPNIQRSATLVLLDALRILDEEQTSSTASDAEETFRLPKRGRAPRSTEPEADAFAGDAAIGAPRGQRGPARASSAGHHPLDEDHNQFSPSHWDAPALQSRPATVASRWMRAALQEVVDAVPESLRDAWMRVASSSFRRRQRPARIVSYIADADVHARARRRLLTFGGVVCLVGALVAAGALLQPIEGSEAGAAVAELVTPSRGPVEHLALGHAHAALGEADQALTAYAAAALAGVSDATALAFIVSRLEASQPLEELELLTLWPDDSVEDALELLALDPSRLVRVHAARVLAARGALSRVAVDQAAILDVQQGSCAARRVAASVLRATGHTRGALTAVERAARAPERCFTKAEVRALQGAIARRL